MVPVQETGAWKDMTGNYYDVLEISRLASPETIAAAWKSLAKKYHPDKNGSKPASRRMREINEAYAILSDAGKRKQYDLELKFQGKSAKRSKAGNGNGNGNGDGNGNGRAIGVGLPVDDFVLGIFEKFALPAFDANARSLYPMARPELQKIVRMGITKLLS